VTVLTRSCGFVEISFGGRITDGAPVRGGLIALPPRLHGPRCSMSLSIGAGAGAGGDREFSYGEWR
jgi:hypothetical protein